MNKFGLLSCGLVVLALAGCNSGGGTAPSSDNSAPSNGTGNAATGNGATDNTTTDNTATDNAAASNTASGNGASTSDASKFTIAVIPKGTTHSYWKSVEAGADKAGKEEGATIIFKGPLKESDRAAQIALVDQFASDGTSAIVLAPLDDVALVKPVRNAKAKKIPVVIIDSALKATPGTDYDSFVSTNNLQGGVLAGQQLVKLLGGKGKVVLLRYQEGSASTMSIAAVFDSPAVAPP